MTENNQKKGSWGKAIFFVIIILFFIKIFSTIDCSDTASKNANREIVNNIFNPSTADSYTQLKNRILNLSFNDINVSFKDKKVIAVIYDIRFDSVVIGSIAITIDNTATILMSNKDNNSIWKAKSKDVINISDTVFKNAYLFKSKMDLFSGQIVKPDLNHIKMYIRTNDMKTYVKDIDYGNKKNDLMTKSMIKGFTDLWDALSKK